MDARERWARSLADTAAHGASAPRRICQLCVESLGVSGGGISMVTAAGNRGVVCATDDTAARIEDLQLTLGEGPCVDAVSAGAPVLVGELGQLVGTGPDRWPAFLEAATAAGVRAAFAFPLRIGAIRVGVLDLYRDRPGELTDEEITGALMAADTAALALLHLDMSPEDAFDGDPGDRSTYQLQVHQATGMVQVQLGVTTEEAFLALRARAFADGQPVADIATEVVQRRLRFTEEDQ
jgi:GAF domain-containing protein